MTVDPQNWLMPYDGAVQTRPATCGRCRNFWPGQAYLQPALHSAEKGNVPPRPAHPARETDMPQTATSRGAIRGHTAELGAIYRALCLPAKQQGELLPRGASYTAGLVSGPGRPFRPRAEERRSPTRSSLAGPVVPPSISVATSATRRRESRARLRSTSKAVTASRR